MAKHELKALLSRLLPYVSGRKQATALFTIAMLLALSHGAFDAPHLHVEPVPIEPSVTVAWTASGNTASRIVTSGWFGQDFMR